MIQLLHTRSASRAAASIIGQPRRIWRTGRQGGKMPFLQASISFQAVGGALDRSLDCLRSLMRADIDARCRLSLSTGWTIEIKLPNAITLATDLINNKLCFGTFSGPYRNPHSLFLYWNRCLSSVHMGHCGQNKTK